FRHSCLIFLFFNAPPTTEIYTLSLHDALPILIASMVTLIVIILANALTVSAAIPYLVEIVQGKAKPRVASWFGWGALALVGAGADRKSTRLNSSHVKISYAVFCLKKKSSNRKA